ncbi:MAG TPA: hypothetical protein VNA04_01395 [Thermoanaerobaculia bacterium]|nr:hypothetical protein [Thermoanaerobaculia bacterium]
MPRLLPAALLWLVPIALHASGLEPHMREVERIRGLSFSQPVHSVTIDRSELPGRLREQLTRTLPYSVAEWGEILSALLLIEEPEQEEAPFEQLLDLYQSQVLAYYDPLTRTFFALRQPPAALQDLPGVPVEDGVIVHELMHALQDQHFEIGPRDLALRKDTDASLAYHAVLEGEASLVMLASMMERAGADFDALVRQPIFDGMLSSVAAADLSLGAGTPPYFAAMLKFPYLEGLRFAVQAYRQGGWAELDRIHADPPRSTREILHPDDYFERRFRPAPFNPEPPPGVRALTVEHLGEFHWSFLLGAANARGWMADRVTVVQDAFCLPTVLVESSWESDDAARRFHAAYARLLDERGIWFLSEVEGKDVRLAYGVDAELMERFLR